MNLKLSRFQFYLIKILVWLFYIFFVINLIAVESSIEIIEGVLFCAVLIEMSLITFINSWFRNGKPKLLDWFRLSTFLYIILNFLSIAKNLKSQNNFDGLIVHAQMLIPSLLTIFVGLVGLLIGEFILKVFKIRKNKNRRIYTYKFRSIQFFYIFTILISVIHMYLMLTGQIGYGTFQENTTSSTSFLFQTLLFISPFLLGVFSIMKYKYNYKDTKFNYIFLLYFIIQVISGFLSGMKESIIVPIIIVAIPYLLSGRKVPKKLVIISSVCFLFIYPINNSFREILNAYPNLPREKAFGLALAKTVDINFSDNIKNSTDNYSSRLSLFPYLVYSVENQQNWKVYKSMDRYIYLPVAWIVPRFILPDKPKSENGGLVNEMIYGRDVGPNSLTVTVYGWSFFEGGYFYVLVLFILLGLVITYFESILGLSSFFGILIYTQLLVLLLKVESDIYFLISSIFQMLLVNYILLKILVKVKMQVKN